MIFNVFMEPKNRFILPLIGLFTPLIFYFILGSFIAPFFTTLGISNDILLAVLGFVFLCVISWGHHEGRSQSKFFKKYTEKMEMIDENKVRADVDNNDVETENISKIPQKRYGTCFFINVYAILIAVGIWVYSSDNFMFGVSSTVGVENVWYSVVVLIVLMFMCSNIFRVIASIMLFRITIGTTLNSIKFILLEEVILYGLIIAYFLLLGGFFF